MSGTPPETYGAKEVGGVWLPGTETHFVEMMSPGTKRFHEIDGKWTYQYHKLSAAMDYQPASRRRRCIDVGAHVGLWSMWLVRYFDQVEMFEPVPDHHRLIPYNIDLSNYRIHTVALGSERGTVTIETAADETGSAHVAQRGGGDKRQGKAGLLTYGNIEMQTLDSFAFEDVDFIKIDVEGFELDVVRGAEETLRRWTPNLVIEQKGNDTLYGDTRNAAVRFLEGLGYRSLRVISGDHIMACG